ncbi:MAG: hypothetical protein ACI81V_000494 [Lentimonas sp.]|jgi:hypothetical protein
MPRFTNKMRHLPPVASLILLTLMLLPGCAREQTPEPMRIVLTADIRGRLVPCGCFTGQLGGMTRLFTRLEQTKTLNELRVDAGDALQGVQDFEIMEYERILEAFGMMDFQALNIGAREAELSAAALSRIQSKAQAPLISANLFSQESGQTILPPYIKTKVGGKIVILTGILHPDSIDPTQLGEGLRLDPPELALKALLPKLREQCDLLVLLAFANEDKLRQLAEQFYEPDFILGGDVSQPSGNTRQINQSHVFYVANESRTIGLIDFVAAYGKQRPSIRINHARPVLLDEDILEAETILQIAQAYREEIRVTPLAIDHPESHPVAQVPGIRPLAHYVGTESCTACHLAEHAIWKDTGHAHAWASLKYKKADADPNCIACHSVGFGSESGYRREFEHEKLINVGCESCHGPGSQHVEERTAGGTALQRFRPLAAGDCRTCHYGEFSRPFDWDTFWPRVAHGQQTTNK